MLSYIERGAGPALLLVHAFPLDHSMWSPQVEEFAARFRVITPDVRGFGGSVPARKWSMADMADELKELLTALRVDQCILVGLSMGGYIAVNFAGKYGESTKKLVLAHTRARADNEVEKERRNDMIRAIERDGVRVLPDMMLGRLLKPNPSPELADAVRNRILATDPTAAIHAVGAMRDRPDAVKTLQTISCPTLVLAGEEDAILKVEDCRAMADHAPHGRFATISMAGHLSNLENPQEFNAVLSGFINE